MTSLPSPSTHEAALAGGARVLAGVFAIAFGLLLVLGAGFAQPSTVHNAAHDARHAFSFPCH